MTGIIQHTLFGPEISTRPTFWYPGSKNSAAPTISKMIPLKTKTVLSPFIGGGAIELSLTARGIRVYASDLYEPLANCWKFIIEDGNKIAIWCKEKLHVISREELMKEIKEEYNKVNKFEQACYQWLRYTLNYRGIVSWGKLLFYIMKPDGNAYLVDTKGKLGPKLTRFRELETFYNPLLSVEDGDYEETLKKYPDLFVYLDPPYYDMSTTTYGDSKLYDRGFDAERLSKVLLERETPFILSYGDHEDVRKLYPESDFDWQFQTWKQINGVGKKISNEVLIRPRKFLDYWD